MTGSRQSFRSSRGAATGRSPLAIGMTIFVVFVCLSIVANDGWRIWNARTTLLDYTAVATENLARAAAQQASDSLGIIDVDTESMIHWLDSHDHNPDELDKLHQLLLSLVEKTPQVTDLVYFDEYGNRIVSAQPFAGRSLNNADQDYFKYHKENPGLEIHLSAPIIGRITKKLIVPVSRRVNHSDGSFGGVVIARLDTTYFQSFYDALGTGQEGSVLMATTDGTLLVRHPFVAENVGLNIAARSPLFNDWLPAMQSGTKQIFAATDGVSRIISWRRLDPFPMVVVGALSKEEALAPWRTDAL